MKTSERGIDLIKRMEGSRPDMYRDFIGLPTIGVGHLLTKDELYSGKIHIDGEQVNWHLGLDTRRVESLLRQDLSTTELVVNSDSQNLNQNQFDALVSFVFNVGPGAYAKSTLRKKILTDDLGDVPDQLMRWTYAGGVISPVLERRRKEESALWGRPEVTGEA